MEQINVTRQSFIWRVLTDRANRWQSPEQFRAKEELRIRASPKGHGLSNWLAVKPGEGLTAKETEGSKGTLFGDIGPLLPQVQLGSEHGAGVQSALKGAGLPLLCAASSSTRQPDREEEGQQPPAREGEGMKLERLQGHAASPRQSSGDNLSSPLSLCGLFF